MSWSCALFQNTAYLLQVKQPAGIAAKALLFVLAQQCCVATESVSQWIDCALSSALPRSLLKAHLYKNWTGCSTCRIHPCPERNWHKSKFLRGKNNKHCGTVWKYLSCSLTHAPTKLNVFLFTLSENHFRSEQALSWRMFCNWGHDLPDLLQKEMNLIRSDQSTRHVGGRVLCSSCLCGFINCSLHHILKKHRELCLSGAYQTQEYTHTLKIAPTFFNCSLNHASHEETCALKCCIVWKLHLNVHPFCA